MPTSESGAFPLVAEQAEADVADGSANGAGPVNGTTPEDSVELAPSDGAETHIVADSTPAMSDSAREPAVPFLQSLVDAMRKIADQTRDDALGKLRAAVAERSAGIRAETEQRAAELHEVADTDLAGVAEWEQGEIQRVRDEAAAKVSARNATLDAQLAANTAAGEGAMTAVEARVEAFEAEMTSFFAQLNDIHDPAALASALKRIPQAPSLTEPVKAPAGDTAPSPAAVAGEVDMTAAADHVTGEPESSAEVASEVAEDHAAAPAMHGQGALEAAAASTAPTAVATAEPVVDEPEVDEHVVVEAAAVDEPAAATPVAATREPVEEATTQVLVTGLTSFGAITSFKQSLEHVDGIVRVSLGLGTSGEFIFTAVHHAGFDLAAAIRSFEETAQFVASNGQLRVTVGSKA